MIDPSVKDGIRSNLSDPFDVARRLGLEQGSKRQGAGLHVLCPAHGERTPSCSLTRGRDGTLRVRCFGCDLAGDVFTLVAAVERLDPSRDFRKVLERAADLAGVYLEGAELPRGAPLAPRPARPAPPVDNGPPPLDVAAFDALVAPLLRSGTLDGSEVSRDVCAYLEGRKLLSLARAEGWAALPRPGPSQASWVRMLRDAFGDDAVDRSGLVRGDSFVAPAARLVIPWRDPSGRVQTLQRRRLDDGKPKYVIPAGRAPAWPYGVHKLAGASPEVQIGIVEGALDAVAFEALAVRHGESAVALGLQGVNQWRGSTASQFAALCKGRAVFIAVDKDRAGEDAVKRIDDDIANKAGGVPMRPKRLTPKSGKDWTDMLSEVADGI